MAIGMTKVHLADVPRHLGWRKCDLQPSCYALLRHLSRESGMFLRSRIAPLLHPIRNWRCPLAMASWGPGHRVWLLLSIPDAIIPKAYPPEAATLSR
jgi:hypothetical protein